MTGKADTIALLIAGASFCPAAAIADEKEVGLVVEAWVSTAGPYGESWDLKLSPSGEVALQVFYSANPSGSLMARFGLSDESVAAVRKVIKSERYFELPPKISPPTAPLHQPDLRLSVWLGGKRHKVQLYDPDQLKGDANAGRFLAIWRRLYEALPLRPSWDGPQNNQMQRTAPGQSERRR